MKFDAKTFAEKLNHSEELKGKFLQDPVPILSEHGLNLTDEQKLTLKSDMTSLESAKNAASSIICPIVIAKG